MKSQSINELSLEMNQRIDNLAAITKKAIETRNLEVRAMSARVRDLEMRVDLVEGLQSLETMEAQEEDEETEAELTAEEEARQMVYLDPAETLRD
jgi:TolA-binding protein